MLTDDVDHKKLSKGTKVDTYVCIQHKSDTTYNKVLKTVWLFSNVFDFLQLSLLIFPVC